MTKQMSQRHISAPPTNFDPNISRTYHNLSQLSITMVKEKNPARINVNQKNHEDLGHKSKSSINLKLILVVET